MRGRRGYRIADTPTGMPFARRRWRPRAPIEALVAVVVIAALLGVLAGAGTGGGSSPTAVSSSPTAAGSSQAGAGSATATGSAGGTSAAAEVDRELGGVLRELAGARAAGLARQDSAGDAAQQATAIAAIAAAYRRAAGQVAAISGSPPRLQVLLADLASSYQSLAAVAKARSVPAYQRLSDRIDSDEQLLRSAAASL